MQRKHRKLLGLLAAALCLVCVLAQPLAGVFAQTTDPQYLGTVVNGWVATCRRATNHENCMNKVRLEKVDDTTTRIIPYDVDDGYAVAGRFDETGDLVESTLKPSADGRYVFTAKISSVGLEADEVYIPFGTEINGHWHRNCEITKDGLRIRLVKSDGGMKLYVDRPVVVQDGQLLDGVRYDTLKAEGVDFSLDTAHRFVIATKETAAKEADGEEVTKAVTSVYVDDVLFGSVETTESYFTAKKGEDTKAVMLGVGSKDTDGSGSAACTVEVSVNGADRAEELSALIAECEALQNDKATDAQKAAFTAAIGEAKTALATGDEVTVAAALHTLTAEKTKFSGAVGASANGWTAVKSSAATMDETAKVLLYALGDEITEIHAPNYVRGAAVKQHGLSPIRTGKFAIDFTLKSESLEGNGHSIWIPILWECYGDAGNPHVAKTNNGIALKLMKNTGGYQLYLQNREANDEEFNDAKFSSEKAKYFSLNETIHFVIETVGGETKVYVNGELYGKASLTDSSNYLWGSTNPTIALGGGPQWDALGGSAGEVVAVIDTHAPDSTEALQALITECEKTDNVNASAEEKAAFAAAIEKAKTDMAGEEPTVLQAIEELAEAELTFASCGEVPERIALRRLIAECEKLAANTEASDTPAFGQTTTEAKATFTAAINAAKGKLEGTTADELTAAAEALTAAQKAFSASVLKDTGWRARWASGIEGLEDHTDEVGIRYVSDGVAELYVGDALTAGADLRGGLSAPKIGKWAFSFTVLPDGTDSTSCDLDWAYTVYDTNGNLYPGNTTNGLQFKLDQLGTSPKLSVFNRDTGETYVSADGQKSDLAVGQTYRVVLETVRVDSDDPLFNEDGWEPFKFKTTLYINDRVYAEYDTPDQNYYWRDNVPLSLGAGGSGRTRLLVDITPETSEQKLHDLIAACEELLNGKTASDTPAVGEVSTAAAAAFRKAIDAAAAAESGTEGELIAAIEALTSAKADFADSVAESTDTRELRKAVTAAEAVRDVLSEETAAYKPLSALIDEAKDLLADDAAEQSAVDAKTAALTAAMDTAKAENLIFTVNKSGKFEPTGLTVKANGQLVRFATDNRDGRLYSRDWFTVRAALKGTKKLVFDITDLGRIDGQYSRVVFADPTGTYRLYAEILQNDGEGLIRICLPPEVENDPSTFIPLAVAEYTVGKSTQVVIEAAADGKLTISVDGEKLYEGADDSAAIFNGTDDITVSLLSGGDRMGEQSMTIDFAAAEKPAADEDNSSGDNSGADTSDNDNPDTGYAAHAAVPAAIILIAGTAVLLTKKRRQIA